MKPTKRAARTLTTTQLEGATGGYVVQSGANAGLAIVFEDHIDMVRKMKFELSGGTGDADM